MERQRGQRPNNVASFFLRGQVLIINENQCTRTSAFLTQSSLSYLLRCMNVISKDTETLFKVEFLNISLETSFVIGQPELRPCQVRTLRVSLSPSKTVTFENFSGLPKCLDVTFNNNSNNNTSSRNKLSVAAVAARTTLAFFILLILPGNNSVA